MISESTNLNMELKVTNGEVESVVGYINASIDANGNTFNLGVNVLNKQLVSENLESIKLQYDTFFTTVIEKASLCGFSFIS